MLCMLFAVAVLVRMLLRWPAYMRRQAVPLAAGTVLMLFCQIAMGLNIMRQVKFTPFVMTVTLLCFAWYTARYRLYDLKSIALERAVDSMDDAIIVLDARWCYQYANPSAFSIFPQLRDLLFGESILLMRDLPRELENSSGVGRVSFEIETDTGKHSYRAHISKVMDRSTAIGWSIVVRDITEIAELLQKMHDLAVTDPLTGIFNRRYFLENVQREMNIARREKMVSCLLIFDIDHFKDINDFYGHTTGDKVLIGIADTVRGELRSYDIIARYGGEEFALFIHNIQGDSARSFAERLCRAVENMRIPNGNKDIHVTASFGLAEVPWDATLEWAIQAADDAMYRAKGNGRNRVEIAETYFAKDPKKEDSQA